jgi:hypothetical protein
MLLANGGAREYGQLVYLRYEILAKMPNPLQIKAFFE